MESNLGTAIRTGGGARDVVDDGLRHRQAGAKLREAIPKGELGFICLSGLATGGKLAVLL